MLFRSHLLSDDAINLTIRSAALQVLREHAVTEKKKDSPRT